MAILLRGTDVTPSMVEAIFSPKDKGHKKWLASYFVPEIAFEAAKGRVGMARDLRSVARRLEGEYIPVLMSAGFKAWTAGLFPELDGLPEIMRRLARHLSVLDGFEKVERRGAPRKMENARIFELVELFKRMTGKTCIRKVADILKIFEAASTAGEDEVKKAWKSVDKIDQGARS